MHVRSPPAHRARLTCAAAAAGYPPRTAVQASTRLYRKAVEWLEDAGKDALAGDVFRCPPGWAGLGWLAGRGGGDSSRVWMWRACKARAMCMQHAVWWSNVHGMAMPDAACAALAPPAPPRVQAGGGAAGAGRGLGRRRVHAAALCGVVRGRGRAQQPVQGVPGGRGGLAARRQGARRVGHLPGAGGGADSGGAAGRACRRSRAAAFGAVKVHIRPADALPLRAPPSAGRPGRRRVHQQRRGVCGGRAVRRVPQVGAVRSQPCQPCLRVAQLAAAAGAAPGPGRVWYAAGNAHPCICPSRLRAAATRR